jgi:Pregnancy-associated plasma protein-A/Secretion system C-terminal sorting domain
MFKKSILLVALGFSTLFAFAQNHCETDAVYNQAVRKYPVIKDVEKQLAQQMENYIKTLSKKQFAKTTADTILYVPIVFHVIHTYGSEYVTDNEIYKCVSDINLMYNKQNPDTSAVIAPFKKWIGKANIKFVFPTKDPQGNPTNGITRRFSYMATNAGDLAKFDQWAPDSYMNVWIVNKFSSDHASAAAYAYKPATAAIPYFAFYDGVITVASYLNTDNTISHELGHELNLDHTFGNTNGNGTQSGIWFTNTCGDDGVDDTPPTKGYNTTGCVPGALYDTTCAKGYKVVYVRPSTGALDSLVDYPDTCNSQNVMDYTYCSKMFTIGQTVRMRAALNSPTAGRNNLISSTNLSKTGALSPRVDLKPVADFSPSTYFVCKTGAPLGTSVTFRDRSWRDTVTGWSWNFSNGASVATATTSTVANTFSQTGWVTASLVASSNAGADTITKKQIYVADPAGNQAIGYFQEFSGADVAQYPMFNYFNNEWKWELADVGYYDNKCIRYHNYDTRSGTAGLALNTPEGDYDDFYTTAFDLSSTPVGSPLNLNFFSSGAFRSANFDDMNDTLEIAYTATCGTNYTTIKKISKADIATVGTRSEFFVPQWQGDWKLNSIDLGTLRNSSVFFRFRYRPGVFSSFDFGSGNNFYIDRIYVSNMPLGVNTVELKEKGMTISPNPTTGNSFISIDGVTNQEVGIQILDVTGKLVYTAREFVFDATTKVQIPADAIATKGMYIVHVLTNEKTLVQKLIKN